MRRWGREGVCVGGAGMCVFKWGRKGLCGTGRVYV